MRILRLVLAAALGAALSTGPAPAQEPPACTIHWDCQQGEFCYKGHCLRDPRQDVYHCGKAGCPPGMDCITPESTRERCAEDVTYPCLTACDCGPAHACLDIPAIGRRCVKDLDDAWLPGGVAIFDAVVPPGEPTYCCARGDCYAGALAAQSAPGFACWDGFTGAASDFCGGRTCRTAADCEEAFEVCVDVYTPPAPLPGGLCTARLGRCVSGAIAEAVFGYPANALLRPCAAAQPGETCEAGWRPGGPFHVARVAGTAGTCGDGACQDWETHRTCPADCLDCPAEGPDATCEAEEQRLLVCLADCGACGDGACGPRESPKTCLADCPVACGDGSCDASEVTACPADCPCASSPGFTDHPSWCGDGFCDPDAGSLEACATCPADCPPLAFHLDQDGDGFGAPAVAATGCAPPPGLVLDGTDCDDAAPLAHPGAPERCNLADDDCDGAVDDGGYAYAGVDPPLRPEGTRARAESTIPVKVRITDCAGAAFPTAAVTVALRPAGAPPPAGGLPLAWDPLAGRYTGLLRTGGLAPGAWTLHVLLGTGERAALPVVLW